MIQLDAMLRATALGTLRGLLAIGAALAYVQALAAVAVVAGIVFLAIRLIG